MFKITCDESGQFFVNGKPVDQKGCGWKQAKSGRWRYSREQNVIDRLTLAFEHGHVTKEEVENCSNHESRKALWEQIKRSTRKFGGASHPAYLDPAEACTEAVLRLTSEQPVNKEAPWYGNTICFTGQMLDRQEKKVLRKKVREIANSVGFLWLDRVTIGCVFLVTGEYKCLTSKTKKAMEYGTGILSPENFWDMVEDAVGRDLPEEKHSDREKKNVKRHKNQIARIVKEGDR